MTRCVVAFEAREIASLRGKSSAITVGNRHGASMPVTNPLEVEARIRTPLGLPTCWSTRRKRPGRPFVCVVAPRSQGAMFWFSRNRLSGS